MAVVVMETVMTVVFSDGEPLACQEKAQHCEDASPRDGCYRRGNFVAGILLLRRAIYATLECNQLGAPSGTWLTMLLPQVILVL